MSIFVFHHIPLYPRAGEVKFRDKIAIQKKAYFIVVKEGYLRQLINFTIGKQVERGCHETGVKSTGFMAARIR